MSDEDKLDKVQAAAYLGISPRTLLRLTEGGKLAHIPKPKNREKDKTYYLRSELDRYKESVTGAPVHQGVVTSDAPQTGDSQALTGVSSVTGMTGAPNSDTLEMLAALVSAGVRASLLEIAPLLVQTAPLAPSEWLTIEQAASWLGLPKRAIARALKVNRGSIRTDGAGRGLRIHAQSIKAHFERV